MASIVYDSFYLDWANGNVTPGSDTYYMMLVTSAYTPSKGSDQKRSNVTNEVTGTGYTAGGTAVTCTVAMNTSTHQLTLTFSNPSWASATISAAAGVIYKHRGGAASADNLVAYCDFGATITSTNGTFQATETSPLTIQN